MTAAVRPPMPVIAGVLLPPVVVATMSPRVRQRRWGGALFMLVDRCRRVELPEMLLAALQTLGLRRLRDLLPDSVAGGIRQKLCRIRHFPGIRSPDFRARSSRLRFEIFCAIVANLATVVTCTANRDRIRAFDRDHADALAVPLPGFPVQPARRLTNQRRQCGSDFLGVGVLQPNYASRRTIGVEPTQHLSHATDIVGEINDDYGVTAAVRADRCPLRAPDQRIARCRPPAAASIERRRMISVTNWLRGLAPARARSGWAAQRNLPLGWMRNATVRRAALRHSRWRASSIEIARNILDFDGGRSLTTVTACPGLVRR